MDSRVVTEENARPGLVGLYRRAPTDKPDGGRYASTRMNIETDKAKAAPSYSRKESMPSGTTSRKDYKHYTYNNTKVIGSGTFGVVYQATVLETGETVAIKKVFQDKRYKNRELSILQELRHPNVISIKHCFFTTADNTEDLYYNIVMDFIPDTIYKVSRTYSRAKQKFPVLLAKVLCYQLLRGLAYIHAIGICHRDIKPQNILVDQANNKTKICDFGSAKKLVKGEANIAYICSRYYRAPELVLGATEYTFATDVWSIGCVFAELFLGEPVFPGESSTDQLVKIVKILGTPTNEQVLGMNPNHKEPLKLPGIRQQPWSKVFKDRCEDAMFLDLISKMLVYVPSDRLTAIRALSHPFFNDLRSSSFKLTGVTPDDLFDFTPEEKKASGHDLDVILPTWYLRMK